MIIVGGGAAGWMTASYFAKFRKDLKITLIESPDIPRMLVGESITPHVTAFFRDLGISVHDWMRATGGVYKFGNKFTNWVYNQGEAEYFSFTYSTPEENYFKDIPQAQQIIDFRPRKTNSGQRNIDHIANLYNQKNIGRYDQYAHSQFHYMDKNVAPFNQEKLLLNQPWSFTQHINAELIAQYLRDNVGVPEGVNHILSTVTQVKHENGFVKELRLSNGEIISGDLFVDCTGFKRLLVNELDWEQKDYENYPINRAWVGQSEYVDQEKEMVNYTESIAEPAGWRFKISLYHRMGNGYCFSPDHTSDEQALEYFKSQITGKITLGPNLITWKPNRLKEFAKNNVVAIGLTMGFIEPMESNMLYNIISGVRRLAQTIAKDNYTWDVYNSETAFAFDDCADFLLAHYTLTQREDTPFWKDMKELGKKLNHPQMAMEKTFSPRSSMFESFAGRNLFPDYMWMQLIAAWGHTSKVNVDANKHELAKTIIYSTEKRHDIISDMMMNNYQWHKQYVYKGTDSQTWRQEQLQTLL